jgi:hypothetical protein
MNEPSETVTLFARVSADVCQRFLGYSKNRLLRAGEKCLVRRKVAEAELHLRPRPVAEGFVLFLQRFHEARILQRYGPHLVHHCLHFRHRLPRRTANLIKCHLNACTVVVETSLCGCRRGSSIQPWAMMYPR